MLLTIVLVVVVAVLGYVYGRKVEAKLVADAWRASKAIEAEVDKLFAPAVVAANAVVSVANVSGSTANVA